MTEAEKRLISDLITQAITKKTFNKHFWPDITDRKGHILNLLENAYQQQDEDIVEKALILGFAFGFSLASKDILIRLMVCDWHHDHGDIAGLLQELQAPESVDALYHAAQMELAYLDYDECYSLAVKCLWALGDIANAHAQQKLTLLSESPIDIIRKEAKQQLKRIATGDRWRRGLHSFVRD